MRPTQSIPGDDERELLRQTVTRVYTRRGDPRRPDLTRAEVWAELTTLGLLGIVVPRDLGGGGGGLVEAGVVCEVRGQSCDFGGYAETVGAAFGFSVGAAPLAGRPGELVRGVAEQGWQLVVLDRSPLQRSADPEADRTGSYTPVDAVRTVAVWHARNDEGAPEVRWNELSVAGQGRLVHSTARQGEREARAGGALSQSARRVAGGAADQIWARTGMAVEGLRYAEIIGACRWLQQDARRYATQRVQFGRPIAEFQAVQHQLVDMLAWVDAGELLVRHALVRIQEGAGGAELARAGAFVRDKAWGCLFGSYNVLGGMGFIEEMPVNTYCRGVLGVLGQLGPVREVEQRSAEFVGPGRWLAQRG